MMSAFVFSETAKEQGLSVTILTRELEGAHPNTAEITLTDTAGKTVSLRGCSIGGGNILITRINGMEVCLTGQYTSLIVLHRDARNHCFRHRNHGAARGQYLQLPPGSPDQRQAGHYDDRA